MVTVRSVKHSDAQAISDIYNHYIVDSVATFEEQKVSAQTIQQRIETTKAQQLPWLVLSDHNRILGYAYAAQWKHRSAYRFSVETTIYLAPDAKAKGYGSTLYSTLFELLKSLPVNSIIAGITLPNESSVKLHEKMGMRQVAHFEEVGFKFGRWLDTGYWQIILNHAIN
ncbi:GNAT family N-acetyltransferase [Thalassotalea marina]|uniref:N-acetyltransferase n=1 Tax=Thalassotalea marina TaxID=1673741 RepID=A0A919BH70_9GAMM|nr:GNAT family N-acetyltransferase [Thalassotalea marina]GHF89213.1 N-acetyltransferase [Thalassotalea marina]